MGLKALRVCNFCQTFTTDTDPPSLLQNEDTFLLFVYIYKWDIFHLNVPQFKYRIEI